jgi:head-tail adaptor
MAIGDYRHHGVFQDPAAPAPDGEGGWIEGWTDLTPPDWPIAVVPATVRDIERVAAGTVITSATHVITGRWRPDVSTATRILFEGRVFHITGIQNVDERDITMQLIAEEQL